MHDEIHDLAAEAARKAKVAKAMTKTLRTLELIHKAGVVVDGNRYALDLSCDILKLKTALGTMGVDDEDALWAKPGV